MRYMSFSHTTEQFLAGTKTVTRRLGWRFLRPGDHVCAVRKVRGRKKGEPIEKLGVIRIVSVRPEPLCEINAADVVREGYSAMTPLEFVELFCRTMRCVPETVITRIEFERIEEAD